MEVPELMLLNKLADPANIAQRAYWHKAIARLDDSLASAVPKGE